MSQVAGRYRAKYPYGSEELTLNADGSYFQRIHINSPAEEIESSGIWTYSSEDQRVDFENFDVVGDGFGGLRKGYQKPRLGIASFPLERNPLTGSLRLGEGDFPPFMKE